jgi:hypothetical protein
MSAVSTGHPAQVGVFVTAIFVLGICAVGAVANIVRTRRMERVADAIPGLLEAWENSRPHLEQACAPFADEDTLEHYEPGTLSLHAKEAHECRVINEWNNKYGGACAWSQSAAAALRRTEWKRRIEVVIANPGAHTPRPFLRWHANQRVRLLEVRDAIERRLSGGG